MDVFEAINLRHSYRGPFAGHPVSKTHLEQIVQAGIQAPSGMNKQTTDFVIVDDPGIVRQIQALHPKNVAMQQGRAYIACILNKQPVAIYEDLNFEIEDCAAAVQNMLLAVTALGYATVWVDGWLRVDGRAETIGQMINLPDDKIIRIILPIGVPLEKHPQKEKELFRNRAWFNHYGCS